MTASVYERVQDAGQAAVRAALLDVASGLLVTEGPQSLSMRRVATAAGCSTTVLYTMFGGKEGLTEALYIEGFARFRRRFQAVPYDPVDPLAYLWDLGRAYRENALAECNYYGLMFEKPIPDFTPSAEAHAAARATFAFLERAVTACMEGGHIGPGDPAVMAGALWAIVHGVVSLELAGHLTDPDTVFETATMACALSFRP